MTLNKLIATFRGAASIMKSRELWAADAAAGKCTVALAKDIKAVKLGDVPACAWADQDKKGCIVNLRYWNFPWPRQYDQFGTVPYDYKLVAPGVGRSPAFKLDPRSCS